MLGLSESHPIINNFIGTSLRISALIKWNFHCPYGRLFFKVLILDGKQLGQLLCERLKQRVSDFQLRYGTLPGLAVIEVGEIEASHIYVNRKIKACQMAGFQSYRFKYPKSLSGEQLTAKIQALNRDPAVHGILIQLPLPGHLKAQEVFSYLDPKKDPDGLTLENKALLWAGQPRIAPCTAAGILALLQHYKVELAGKKAVVVGRSQIVGLPTAGLLLQYQATVTVCHSRTPNLSEVTVLGDIVVVSAGKKWLLSKKDFKKGAVVIDVGIHRNRQNGRTVLTGDVEPEGLDSHLKALSPVPGGVGPMTIAFLLENTFLLAKQLEDEKLKNLDRFQ